MPVQYIQRSEGGPGVPPQDNIVCFPITVGAAQADGNFFIADTDYEVIRVAEVHSVAGAASSTLDIKKCTGTTAPASGTTILASTFALDSTVNTNVSKTSASGLSATRSTRRLTAGDRLAYDFTGTVTAYVGTIQVHLRRLSNSSDMVGF